MLVDFGCEISKVGFERGCKISIENQLGKDVKIIPVLSLMNGQIKLTIVVSTGNT